MSEPVTDALTLAQRTLLGEAVDCLQQVAVFVWDEDRNYVAVNDFACELVGRTREELLQMRLGDMSPNRASPLFEEVQHGGVHTGSLTVHRPDGDVEIEWFTCHARVAGLPYMLSVCWPKRD
jgi:PAS domain-containing protein